MIDANGGAVVSRVDIVDAADPNENLLFGQQDGGGGGIGGFLGGLFGVVQRTVAGATRLVSDKVTLRDIK